MRPNASIVARGALTRHLPKWLLPVAARMRETAYGRAFTQRRFAGVLDEARWQLRKLKDASRHQALQRQPAERRAALAAALGEGIVSTPEISAFCLSRRLGNRDSNLPRMLESLLATAERPERLEILVKIDLDDDLDYYMRIKRHYADRLALRIFATERRRGPADMHIFYSELLGEVAPSAKIVLGVTDDGIFGRPNWDTELVQAPDEAGSDMFMGGELPFEQVVTLEESLQARNATTPIFQYGSNNFWYVSVPLLRLIGEVARNEPGWTPFGRSLCVDTFISSIVATAWDEHALRLYIQRDRFMLRTGIVSFMFDTDRDRIRTAGLLDLMSAEHKEVRRRIVDRIVADIPHAAEPALPRREVTRK